MYVDRAEPPNLPHDLLGCKVSIPWRHSDTSFTLWVFFDGRDTRRDPAQSQAAFTSDALVRSRHGGWILPL